MILQLRRLAVIMLILQVKKVLIRTVHIKTTIDHHSINSSDAFILFQLQLEDNINIDVAIKIYNTVSCTYENLKIDCNYTNSIDGHNEYIQYSGEINGNTGVSVNGDVYTDLASILNSSKTEINGSDTFTAWDNAYLFETCHPFHASAMNYADVRYNGAKFDDIAVDGKFSYFVKYSNAASEFVECSIHKVEREDVILAIFHLNFLSSATFKSQCIIYTR